MSSSPDGAGLLPVISTGVRYLALCHVLYRLGLVWHLRVCLLLVFPRMTPFSLP